MARAKLVRACPFDSSNFSSFATSLCSSLSEEPSAESPAPTYSGLSAGSGSSSSAGNAGSCWSTPRNEYHFGYYGSGRTSGWGNRSNGWDCGSEREVNPFGDGDNAEQAFSEQENTGINVDAYEDIPVEISGEKVSLPANTFAEIDLAAAFCFPIISGVMRGQPVQWPPCGVRTPYSESPCTCSLTNQGAINATELDSVQMHMLCSGRMTLNVFGYIFAIGNSKNCLLSMLICNCMQLYLELLIVHYSSAIAEEGCGAASGHYFSAIAECFAVMAVAACFVAKILSLCNAKQPYNEILLGFQFCPQNDVVLKLWDLERGVDILVATPGRLVDMLERARVSL
ncbi:hypothetical protein VNO77_01209 [Canavalia gladiata]|uniref:Uncharacterized protein n=1 Tax=Canavalia gladiata TaxID=3824 RepID=A0AAN9R527_CANGL